MFTSRRGSSSQERVEDDRGELEGQSHLVLSLAKGLLDELLRPGRKGRERSTTKAMSAGLKLRMCGRAQRRERRVGVRDVLSESLKLVHGDGWTQMYSSG